MAYYDRYRGSRRRRQNRIKTVLLVLLLLVVIGLAALFVLQETAIFTHDGFRFPFAGRRRIPRRIPTTVRTSSWRFRIPSPMCPSLLPPPIR